MSYDSILQVRLESATKDKVEELFGALGMTSADAVRLFLLQCLECQGLPFEVRKASPVTRRLNAYGMAAKYADKEKMSLEKNAWLAAAGKKHEDS